MGFERRLVRRTDVEVQGTLEWATKRRIGGVKQHRAQVTTVDLSVGGAKVIAEPGVKLPVGASCRLEFEGESSPARILGVQRNDARQQLFSMRLEHPPSAFMRVIDQWISGRENGWKFDDTGWSGQGVVDDLFTDRAA